MAFKVKSGRGRKRNLLKIRNLEGITPKGFVLHKISVRNKQAIYKRVD